jgi:hypothetical protein
MENNNATKNTPAWRFQVWASFALAMTLMCVGIYHLPVDWWMKGYLAMGLIFTVGSCFGLAKTIRDDFEVDKLAKDNTNNAKTETIIREYKN